MQLSTLILDHIDETDTNFLSKSKIFLRREEFQCDEPLVVKVPYGQHLLQVSL